MQSVLPLPSQGVSGRQQESASRPSNPTDFITPVPASRQRSFQDDLHYPAALPCYGYYERQSKRRCPMGNVVLTDPDELAPFLLVAKRVSAKEAQKHGGCVVYTPPPKAQKSKHAPAPQYYCITATDDEVYGRGAYYSLPQKLKQAPSVLLTGSFDSDTSRDGCSEDREDEMGVSTCSMKLPSRRGSSVLFERPSF